MKPGNLVRIARPSIGVPKDSVGLIVERFAPDDRERRFDIWIIELMNSRRLRYLTQDLRKIN